MTNFPKLTQSSNLIKVLSFIVAFTLWLYVINDQNPTITRVYTVPLEYRNILENLVVMNEQTTVRVKISGNRNNFSDISANDISVYVDLQGLEKGMHEKPIYAKIPSNVQLVEITPPSISVVADTKIRSNFPINVRFDNKLPPELTVRTLSLVPNIVTIEGAATWIEKIRQVEAVFVLDSNMSSKGQYRANVSVNAVDGSGNIVKNITLDPSRAFVTIEVIDSIIDKEVPVKVAYTGKLPSGYKLANTIITPQKIILRGPAAKLNELQEVALKEININYLNNDFVGDIGLDLPAQVSTDTERVNVILRVERE